MFSTFVHMRPGWADLSVARPLESRGRPEVIATEKEGYFPYHVGWRAKVEDLHARKPECGVEVYQKTCYLLTEWDEK